MKLTISITLLTTLLLSNNVFGKETFYKDRERGWFWYEDPKEKESTKIEKKTEKNEPVIPSPKILSPREILKKQGENWENSLAQAVLKPTKRNVLNYVAQTSKINEQAEKFSRAFKEAIWVNPQYDYSIKSPHNPQALIAKNEQNNKNNEDELKSMASRSGLIYLFDPNCPVCHRFSPLLKQFEEYFGFEVIAVSSNGQGIKEYPSPQENIDFGSRVNNKIYPSLFLVEPSSGKITPVTYGHADWSTLIKKTLSAGRRINE